MPKQTTDHRPANEKILEIQEDSTVTYISCEKALAILEAKWQATKEEMAAWVFLGPEQGGLAAFLDAYQITPPRQFFYPYCAGRKDYLWPLSLWWFRQNDIEQFVPADRYITGASLIERWSTLKSSLPEDYIIARVRESRLVDMHPTFGGTQATFENPLPGLSYPPVETGLFSIKQIEALEVEEGITPSTAPVAAPPTTAETEKQPASSQESLAAEADVDLKSPPGANDMVVGPAKLCRAFGLGENSFSAVTRRVKAYNDRYPDAPIQFGRIGQSPSLRSREIWKIIEKTGSSSGKRTRKKTSKKT